MKVVIAIDSFKGSMSSLEAGMAAREGVLCAFPDANVVVKPLADGGEGTVEALINATGGHYEYVEVTGPDRNKVQARYGVTPEGVVVMEIAEAAGIALLKREKLDPRTAVTIGVGELILDAVDKGYKKFLIGIGGSATTECGIGMLSALGYRFYDDSRSEIEPEFDSLEKVAYIDASGARDLSNCKFKIACDVNNPLYGKNGAVYVFGPQKGVKEHEKEPMDEAVKKYADVCMAFSGNDYTQHPGAGASGGLGFCFLNFLDGELMRGIDQVLETSCIEKDISDADVVITGEGRLDGQSLMGKVPIGVATLGKKHKCKVLAFAGSLTEGAKELNKYGIDAFFCIQKGAVSLEEAMERANSMENLRDTVCQAMNLLK